ncbi:MICOS complex subunit MIC60-like, partial [Ostrinia furnacalis]|uniref:MICOS complex subunit MIC60-like n=1 Tax=Ostrinia furnacalis TaxID=93504 RepID=UPI00103A54B4
LKVANVLTGFFKVEELVTKYTDENQTLFSGLRYDHKKPVLQGDPDLLLYHTFRYATKLKTELCEASAGMTERINRGLETLPQTEKDLKNRNYAIQAEYKKRKYELDREYRKRADDQRANNDKTLKDALKKQLERHEEQLQIKLAQKEKETTIKLNKMVAEKVAAEKKIFANQLAEMAAKLKIVEDKLNARLKAERETRRSQQLWEAGASLLAATKKGDKVIRVDKELKAIENASGDDDKLVKTVLKAIPESVRTNGIVPESVLRERYHRMEKAALRVALVEQDGGPLPIYFLSWLQSMMLFMK